jgi:hypothetical protein
MSTQKRFANGRALAVGFCVMCAAVALAAAAMGGPSPVPVAPTPAPATLAPAPDAPSPAPAAPLPAPAAPAPAVAAGKPTYMVIPIRGMIGRDFSSLLMKAYLERAAKLKPTVVVLDIDTGGGDIGEAEQTVDLLIGAKDFRVVARVHRALSAGATITLACKEIYMTPGAMIGGAVSYRLNRDGVPVQLPADVAEKYQSVWRAVCRKAAEHGDHPSLLAEAMVDPAFSLTMRRDGDRVIIERGGTGDVLKAEGRVLTLTAREAVACGLSRGIIEDWAALGSRLGLAGWQEVAVWRSPATASAQTASLEQAPFAFYDTVSQKAASFKTADLQTDLQKREAQKQWKTWLEQERIPGRRIQWTLSMIEASDADTPRILSTLKDGLAKLKEQLAKYAQVARQSVLYPNQREAERKELQGQIATLTTDIKRIETCPIWVVASCPDEPRFLVGAWVGKPYKEVLAGVSPKTEFSLSGNVFAVRRFTTKDGVILIMAGLEQCSLQTDGTATASSTSGSAAAGSNAAEQAARNRLNLVRAFRRNGFPDKAEAVLKQILAEHPNTAAAAEAQKQLAEVQQELKQAGPKGP